MEMLDFSNYTGKLNETLSESIVPPILQGSFGIFGNLLALILLFYYSKSHRWGEFYKYVFALAITDLCGLLFHYPVAITRYASNFEFEFPEKFCYFDVFLFSFSFLSSAMIVCAMSCDRLFAVRYPITYRHGNHKTKRVLMAIWVFSAMIASFPLLGFGSVKIYYPGTWCFINFASRRCLDRINTYVYSSLCLLILLITVIANTAVIYSVCKYDKQDGILSNDFERRKRKNDETYIVTLMLSIVIVFSVCWIPLVIRMMINASAKDPKNGPEELLAVRMTISNAIIDPWIYIILRKENLVKISRLVKRISSGKHLPAIFITTESQELGDGSKTTENVSETTTVTASTQI